RQGSTCSHSDVALCQAVNSPETEEFQCLPLRSSLLSGLIWIVLGRKRQQSHRQNNSDGSIDHQFGILDCNCNLSTEAIDQIKRRKHFHPSPVPLPMFVTAPEPRGRNLFVQGGKIAC